MESGGPSPGQNWLRTQAEKEAKGDILGFSSRFGQLIGIVIGLVMIVFVAYHQTKPTGFFVGDSGDIAAAILYVVFVVGIIPMLVRFVTGRKNRARPYEALGNAIFFAGLLYLLAAFPFDFSFFADPLPGSLEFLLDWVTPTFAKWVLGIGVFGGIIGAVYNLILYREVKLCLAKTETPSAKTGE